MPAANAAHPRGRAPAHGDASRPAGLPVPAAPTTPPQITRPHQAEQGSQPEIYLSLQPSEQAVVHAASRIFSAYVAAGKVTATNEAEMLAKAVRNAMRMAVYTDKLIKSDEEPG